VAGKVAWITPARAANNRTQGIGIRFPEGPKSQALRQKIEAILGSLLASDRQTQTV
jgi:type IV pilus assembly protein PilZ